MKTVGLSMALALGLGGCVSVIPQPPPPPTLYALQLADAQRPDRPLSATAAVVSVTEPDALQHLAGPDIVWQRFGTVAVMEQSAWADSAPRLLQSLLIDQLLADQSVQTVVRPGMAVRADLEVRWSIGAFQIEETEAGLNARFTATVHFVDTRTRMVIGTEQVDLVRPVPVRRRQTAAAELQSVARDGVQAIAGRIAEVAAQPRAASTSR